MLAKLASLFALLVLLIGAGSAEGVTFTFSSGQYAASASFEKVGSNLVVTLTNTSAYDVTNPSEVLTAVFFDLSGNCNLNPSTAVLGPGSSALFDSQPAGGVVGGEWAFEQNISAKAPGGADYGISSTGLDVFGKYNRFDGPNLDGQKAVDGLNYGITSAGDDPDKGNAKVTGGVPLIQNSVIFTLTGLSSCFNPTTDVGNVWFQYGTDLCEPHFPGTKTTPNPLTPIPEPLTASMVALAAAGVGIYLRRRRAMA